jgi:hypothetical protein
MCGDILSYTVDPRSYLGKNCALKFKFKKDSVLYSFTERLKSLEKSESSSHGQLLGSVLSFLRALGTNLRVKLKFLSFYLARRKKKVRNWG